MLNLHLLEYALKGYDHISDLSLAKYWVIAGCKYKDCTDLEKFYLGNSIESIGDYAFDGCNSLLEIYASSKKAIECSKDGIFEGTIWVNVHDVEEVRKICDTLKKVKNIQTIARID